MKNISLKLVLTTALIANPEDPIGGIYVAEEIFTFLAAVLPLAF